MYIYVNMCIYICVHTYVYIHTYMYYYFYFFLFFVCQPDDGKGTGVRWWDLTRPPAQPTSNTCKQIAKTAKGRASARGSNRISRQRLETNLPSHRCPSSGRRSPRTLGDTRCRSKRRTHGSCTSTRYNEKEEKMHACIMQGCTVPVRSGLVQIRCRSA